MRTRSALLAVPLAQLCSQPCLPSVGQKLRDSPTSNPSHRSPCPPAWDHLSPKSWLDWGNQSPGSAARDRILVLLPAHALLGAGQGIAGCRSGYHWVHPCFLFALLSNLTGSWLAGRLAQAHPGDPSAPPKSCCGVLLRLCQGLGCTAGTRPAAHSLSETLPMARSLGSHFCIYFRPPWGHVCMRCCRKLSRAKQPRASQSFSCCGV